MSRRPAGDLGALIVSKDAAAGAVPFAAAPTPGPLPSAPAAGGMPKSLTVKLDAAAYAKLRAYCFAQELATGRRLTHQEIMVRALDELLAREKA